MEYFSNRIEKYLLILQNSISVPPGISVLNPYINTETMSYCNSFYSKYYNDNNKRLFLFGINPGRLGAGLTGIGFTDPFHLSDKCRIENILSKKKELSSTFIYELIEAYGGVDLFFSKFFITSICPLGFVKNKKNINYYDDKELIRSTEPFIVKAMENQIALGAIQSACICFGEGKNYKYFSSLNEKYKWFDKIYPLPHPRYILQYKRKSKLVYLDKYIKTLQKTEQHK